MPERRAAILAANHSNALVDIAIIMSRMPRFPHFLAAASWWRWAPARVVLRLGGAVAIHRGRDGDVRKNVQAFAACHDALASGATIAIFPEGEVEVDSVLLPLQKGAARIALRGAADVGLTDVVIVPVGVAYEKRGKFRSDVEMHLGEPIAIDDDWLGRYRVEPAKTVRAVTELLAERLADAALTAECPGHATMVERAAALTLAGREGATFMELNALRRELTRGLIDASGTTSAAFQELEDAVNTASDDLARLGLHDPAAVPADSSSRRSQRARLTAELVMLAPVAAMGALANAPVLAGVMLASTPVRHGVWEDTTRGLIGTVVSPLVWIGEFGVLSRHLGSRRALLAVAAGAVSGLASLAWWDRLRARRQVVRRDRLERNHSADLERARTSSAIVARQVCALIEQAAAGSPTTLASPHGPGHPTPSA